MEETRSMLDEKAHGEIRAAGRARTVGLILLTHLVLICLVKVSSGVGEEVLWLSQASLLAAGMGFVRGSHTLISIALVNVLVLHSVWIADCGIGLATGTFPIGVASYVIGADSWQWLGTAHHFYLAPLLMARQMRRPAPRVVVLVYSTLMFAVLTCSSRMALPAHANVNWAFHIEIARWSPFIRWTNSLEAAPYLAILNALVFGLLLLPTWVALGRVGTGSTAYEQDPMPLEGRRC